MCGRGFPSKIAEHSTGSSGDRARNGRESTYGFSSVAETIASQCRLLLFVPSANQREQTSRRPSAGLCEKWKTFSSVRSVSGSEFWYRKASPARSHLGQYLFMFRRFFFQRTNGGLRWLLFPAAIEREQALEKFPCSVPIGSRIEHGDKNLIRLSLGLKSETLSCGAASEGAASQIGFSYHGFRTGADLFHGGEVSVHFVDIWK